MKRLLQKLRPRRKHKLLLIGTDYASYKLCERIKRDFLTLEVSFIINEEPWLHKTVLLDAELRYPSEMIPLIRKHNIRRVLCATDHDLIKTQADYGVEITKAGAQLEKIDNEEQLSKLEEALRLND